MVSRCPRQGGCLPPKLCRIIWYCYSVELQTHEENVVDEIKTKRLIFTKHKGEEKVLTTAADPRRRKSGKSPMITSEKKIVCRFIVEWFCDFQYGKKFI